MRESLKWRQPTKTKNVGNKMNRNNLFTHGATRNFGGFVPEFTNKLSNTSGKTIHLNLSINSTEHCGGKVSVPKKFLRQKLVKFGDVSPRT